LSFVPGYLLNAADVLGALIELHWRERRDAAKLGQRNLSKFVGAGLYNPCADASQAVEPKYTTIPEH
jgi:hypothetical protein